MQDIAAERGIFPIDMSKEVQKVFDNEKSKIEINSKFLPNAEEKIPKILRKPVLRNPVNQMFDPRFDQEHPNMGKNEDEEDMMPDILAN